MTDKFKIITHFPDNIVSYVTKENTYNQNVRLKCVLCFICEIKSFFFFFWCPSSKLTRKIQNTKQVKVERFIKSLFILFHFIHSVLPQYSKQFNKTLSCQWNVIAKILNLLYCRSETEIRNEIKRAKLSELLLMESEMKDKSS